MIRALSSFLTLMLVARSSAQTIEVPDLVSPCPNVFSYDLLATETNKWFGVVNLTTDIPLYSLWLSIVLDNKANILGNWLGEVTTDDNIEFEIENTNISINPEELLSVRFFVQYNAGAIPPQLKAIRFNGREICRGEPQVVKSAVPVRATVSNEEVTPGVTTSTTARPTVTTSSRNDNQQQTTLKAETKKPQNTTNSRFWTLTTPEPTKTTTLNPQFLYQTEKLQTTTNSQSWNLTTPEPMKTTTLNPQLLYQTEKPQTTTNSRSWTLTTPEPTKTTTVKPQFLNQTEKPQTTTNSRSWTLTTPEPKKTTTLKPQFLNQTEKPQTTTNSRFWTLTTPEPMKTTTSKPQYWTEAPTLESTQQTQYWQQIVPTLKPLFWTPPKTELNTQTIVRTPGWHFVEAVNNQQVISTVKPTTQTRFPTRTTENNSVSGQVQSLPYSQTEDRNRTVNSQSLLQEQNNQRTTSGNKYQIQNEIKQQITEMAPVWPNHMKVAENQNASNFQIEVKQEEDIKYWTKIPENTTVVAVKASVTTSYGWSGYQQRAPDSGLQNQPYAKIPINQAESTQNLDSSRATPYVRPGDGQRNGMVIQSGVDPSRYPTNDGRIKTFDGSSLTLEKFHITTELPVPSPSQIEENDYSKQEEAYEGGLPIFFIPLDFGPENTAEQCGKVFLNKQTAQSLESTSTLEGQWPWQIALYQQQNSVELRYKYICGGTLVSKRHVITAAHCVTTRKSARLVNKDVLMVFLGKHNLRTSVKGVEIKFVHNIQIYPEYDPANLRSNLAILQLRDTVTFSDRIQPICLWPEQETDLQNVVGKKGYTLTWENEVKNLPREELAQLQMEVVDQRTCLSSHPDVFGRLITDKTYCAGFSSTATCNGLDSGGGMVFQNGGSWYLRGVVSLLVARQGPHYCDPKRYVIFTDVAKFLPWIQDNIED